MLYDKVKGKIQMSTSLTSLSELFQSPTAYILDAMMREATKELTPQELVKKTVLSRASIHRYLHLLLGYDLICKTRESGKFAATYKLNMGSDLVGLLFKMAAFIDDQEQSSRRGL